MKNIRSLINSFICYMFGWDKNSFKINENFRLAEKNYLSVWLLSNRWDGKDHLSQLAKTITVDTNLMSEHEKNHLIKKWLVNALFSGLDMTNCVTPVLTFYTNGNLAMGKTRWFNRLCLSIFRVQADSNISNPGSVQHALSGWMCDLGDLDYMAAQDASNLKKFLTELTIHYRQPHEPIKRFKRQTVFFGTTTNPDFLNQETKNRRYYVIPISRIDCEHDIDMQQVFAQCLHHFQDDCF